MLMTISGKVSDMFSLTVGENHTTAFDYDGYVPSDLGIGGGDYVEITIDLATGTIENWTPITIDDVKAACRDEDDEDDEEDEVYIPTPEHLLEEAQIQSLKMETAGVLETAIDFCPDGRVKYNHWWIQVLGDFQFHICQGDDPMDPDGVNTNESWHQDLRSALAVIHA